MSKLEDAYNDGYRGGFAEGYQKALEDRGLVQKRTGISGNANRTGQYQRPAEPSKSTAIRVSEVSFAPKEHGK